MAFQDLMQHIRRDPPTREDWEQLGCISVALSATDEAVVCEQLSRVQSLGGSLRQVGSLALFSNAPLVGEVLATRFAIRPHDYRSTGGEPGVDSKPGYPLLAHLAFMGELELMERALDWGADPDACWKVKRIMGAYHEGAETISWVGECARRGRHEFLDLLLPRCAPPSVEEQDRRLVALDRCIHQGGKQQAHDARATLALFAPGSVHALSRSFWDITPRPDETLGIDLAVGATHANPALPEHAHWPAVIHWLEHTAPADGTQQMCIGIHLATAQGNFPRRLPQWCLDALSDNQAQTVLEHGFANALVRAFSGVQSGFGGKAFSTELEQHMEVHAPLLQRLATTTEVFPHAFTQVLAHLPGSKVQSAPLAAWEAFDKHWPKHLAPLSAQPLFGELVQLTCDREAASARKDHPAQVQAHRHLTALHDAAVLATQSPAPQASRMGPRL